MKEKTKELADSVGAVYPVLFMGGHDGVLFTETELETFVELVAAHKAEIALAEAYRCGYEAGAVEEREACAKLARKIGDATEPDDWALDKCQDIEAAIRARGTT